MINFKVIFTCWLLFFPAFVIAGSDYVVWPPGNEGGTFYLTSESDNDYSRKGYIVAMTTITLKENNGVIISKWVKESHDGKEHKYVNFVSSTGASGYIKKKSIKSLHDLSVRQGKKIIKDGFSNVIVPTGSLKNIKIFKANKSGVMKLKKEFSRSTRFFVVSNGNKKHIESNDVRTTYLQVKYFIPLKSGSVNIADGWINFGEIGHNFIMLPSKVDMNSEIISINDLSMLEKISRILSEVISGTDGNELVRGFNKECKANLTFTTNLNLSAKIPLRFAELGFGLEGKYNYTIPSDYRFKVDIFHDKNIADDINVYQTIKCQKNTNSDFYVERAVFVRDTIKFDLFKETLYPEIKEYFDVSNGIGPIPKMIQLKTPENSTKDVFTAFYKLRNFMAKNYYSKYKLDPIDQSRLNTLIIEHITKI